MEEEMLLKYPWDADAAVYLSIPLETPMNVLELMMAGYKREVGAIYGPDGMMKWSPKVGTQDAIVWHPAELESMRDADLTHSHPGGGTFSSADLVTSIGWNARSVRAVGVSGGRISETFQIVRPGPTWTIAADEGAMAEFYIYAARANLKEPPERGECLDYMASIRGTALYETIQRFTPTLTAYYTAQIRSREQMETFAHPRSINVLPLSVRHDIEHHCLKSEMDKLGVEYTKT